MSSRGNVVMLNDLGRLAASPVREISKDAEVEYRKYVSMILSMGTDYLMGGLTRGTFQRNLRMVSDQMDELFPILAVADMTPSPSA